MKKHTTFTILFLFLCATTFAFTKRYLSVKEQHAIDSDKMNVVASFYPLYFFAQAIGGEYSTVINLTPSGSEPHDYDPSPQQVGQITRSQLLILNGGGFEPWSEPFTGPEKPANLHTIVVTQELETDDPHVWLNPRLAIQVVETITNAFVTIDPLHQTTYAQNAMILTKQLQQLDAEYQSGLAQCTKKEFVTAHEAFGHLAAAYGLHQVAISGLSPEEEPSPSQMAEIVAFIKANDVNIVFTESLISPKLAETIATETNAQTLTLNPLEGLTQEEIESGEDYFSLMRENLTNLRIALECQ